MQYVNMNAVKPLLQSQHVAAQPDDRPYRATLHYIAIKLATIARVYSCNTPDQVCQTYYVSMLSPASKSSKCSYAIGELCRQLAAS